MPGPPARAYAAVVPMNAWGRLWHAPIAHERSWLFRRGLLLAVGCDAWFNRVPHGGSYGAGGYNIAHFDWIDTYLPLPTPGSYIAVQLVTAVLAIAAALGGGRWIVGLVALGWTWGWAMSQLDAYQHHYLLSLLLFSAFLQGVTRADAPGGGAWTWRLGGVNIAIVYLFATLTKLDATWVDGTVMSGSLGRALAPFADALLGAGLPASAVWGVLSKGALATDLMVGVAYLASLRRDGGGERQGPLVSALCWLGVALALGFHTAIHVAGFRIGWFSFYMIFCAGCWLLPGAWVRAAVSRLPAMPDRIMPFAAAFVVLAFAAAFGFASDLPGGLEAGLIAGLVLAGWTGRSAVRLGAGLLAVATVWLGLVTTDVRAAYFDNVSDVELRLGHLDASLEAAHHAARYGRDATAREGHVQAIRDYLSGASQTLPGPMPSDDP